MASEAQDPLKGKWGPAAWTPLRCEVWHAMPAEERPAFEKWVQAEKNSPFRHDTQILPEHEKWRKAK